MTSSHSKLPIGTFINMGTVTIGSLAGMALQQAFPPSIQAIIFQAIGLGTLVLGVKMSLSIPEGYLLNFIFSLILGAIIGELMGLQTLFHSMGDWVKSGLQLDSSYFTEGLVTAFLLFCVGSMTLVGAIEEGLEGKRELLIVKSTLDGVSSIAFASTYGIGVLFSIIPMLIFQGGMTVLARRVQHFFTPNMIAQMSAVGGALIIGIGINLLKIGTVNIENLLPALVVTQMISWIQEKWR